MKAMFTTICLPTRPQPDSICAIYLLKAYGEKAFPGIKDATIEIRMQLDPGKTADDYEKEGVILIDVGGGKFDHHGMQPATTASFLVAKHLGITGDKSIERILAYTDRDDKYGKGTVSNDPLDRAFGLSGLIGALNKNHTEHPERVVDFVLPFIAAHHAEERRRYEELPREMAEMKSAGKFGEAIVKQKQNKLGIAFVESDNVSLPGYLRSQMGGKYDAVVQRRSTGHVNILTRPMKRPDLRKLAAFIRMREYEITKGSMILKNDQELQNPGRVDEVPNWYYDPATNSIQNGGVNTHLVEATKIPWEELKKIVEAGLEM